MPTQSNLAETGNVTEMAVVDTFTRLIFGDEDDFNPYEETIIAAFRHVDNNVLLDSHAQMGDYLRSLGVREMIHLVARIRERLQQDVAAAMRTVAASAEGRVSGAGRSKVPHQA
jgi:hypothetical protein